MSLKTHDQLVQDVADKMDIDPELVKFVTTHFWKMVRYYLTNAHKYVTKGVMITKLGVFYRKEMYKETAEKVINRLKYIPEEEKPKIINFLCRNKKQDLICKMDSQIQKT